LYSVPAMYSKAVGSILFKLVTYIFIIDKAIVFSTGHVSDINCLCSDIISWCMAGQFRFLSPRLHGIHHIWVRSYNMYGLDGR